eukprot:COSAG02_NODE_4580_length_5199_cov_6.923137_2_plen_63_part_00
MHGLLEVFNVCWQLTYLCGFCLMRAQNERASDGPLRPGMYTMYYELAGSHWFSYFRCQMAAT